MQLDREWKKRMKQCEQTTCSHMPELENDNCVNECTSKSCYDKVYGAEPVGGARCGRERRTRVVRQPPPASPLRSTACLARAHAANVDLCVW